MAIQNSGVEWNECCVENRILFYFQSEIDMYTSWSDVWPCTGFFFLWPRNLDINIPSLPSFLLFLCPPFPSLLRSRTKLAAMALKWVIKFVTLNFNFSALDIISFNDSILVFAFSQVLQICMNTSTWWERSLCLNMRH